MLVIRTAEDVDDAVARIRVFADAGDHEAAHGLEDELYTAVLRRLARSDVELAKRALRTQRFGHRRDCA